MNDDSPATVDNESGQDSHSRDEQHEFLTRDWLTGLPSRAVLKDRIELELEHARRDKTQLSLLHLDPFPISDIGHLFGYEFSDLVIQQIARRIQACIRASDTLIRMDADEFAVLLPTAGRNEASLVAAKIGQALELPIVANDITVHVGVTTGVASWPEYCENADELMRGDLRACKRAKADHVALIHYNGNRDSEASANLKIFGELRQAIHSNRLSLLWQPKVSLQTGQMIGAEALVR